MPRWDYTIQAKDLLTHSQDDEENTKVALDSAPIMVGRIKKLIEKLQKHADDNYWIIDDLDRVVWAFEDVKDNNEGDPLETFNDALAQLYDVGDQHRIWVK